MSKIDELIARLDQMPKHGASYDHKGRHGWTNPIRTDTGPVLRALVAAKAPTRVLEIGTAHGLSCATMASAAPTAQFTCIEWQESLAKEASDNLRGAGVNAEVICGDAMKIIEGLSGRLPFDLVFMDANKDGYLEQLLALQSRRLLAPGCVVIADNVIDRQKECQNFLDYLSGFPHVILEVGHEEGSTEVAGLLVVRF